MLYLRPRFQANAQSKYDDLFPAGQSCTHGQEACRNAKRSRTRQAHVITIRASQNSTTCVGFRGLDLSPHSISAWSSRFGPIKQATQFWVCSRVLARASFGVPPTAARSGFRNFGYGVCSNASDTRFNCFLVAMCFLSHVTSCGEDNGLPEPSVGSTGITLPTPHTHLGGNVEISQVRLDGVLKLVLDEANS